MCPRGRPRGQGRPRGLHLWCKGRLTTGLFRHFKSKHKLSLGRDEDQTCSSNKQKLSRNRLCRFWKAKRKVCKLLSFNLHL